MFRIVTGNGQHARAVKVPFWAGLIVAAAVLALVAVIFTLIAGTLLVVIPTIVIAAVLAKFLPGQRRGPREPIFTRDRPRDPNVIEGEYRVLDERRP